MNKTLAFLLSSSLLFSSLSAEEKKSVNANKQEMTYPVNGTLYPIQLTKISSQVAGRILEIHADVGSIVAKDQILMKLDPVFFDMEYQKAENAFQMASLLYEDAGKEYQRMKNLWEKTGDEKPSVSKKQYEDAMTHFKQKQILLSQAALDLEYLKTRLSEASIKAPYSGVITKRYVDIGETISTTPIVHLLEIMDASKIIFEFSLPQDISYQVKEGMAVITEIEGLKQAFVGKIDTVFPSVDSTNRCFKCKVILDNEKGLLRPGSFARGKIQLK